MIKGTIACGVGVAFALALLLPANVSARGFPHPGLHRAHQHRQMSWPYGYGPVATYAPGDYRRARHRAARASRAGSRARAALRA